MFSINTFNIVRGILNHIRNDISMKKTNTIYIQAPIVCSPLKQDIKQRSKQQNIYVH
jgi:hypothetical protein